MQKLNLILGFCGTFATTRTYVNFFYQMFDVALSKEQDLSEDIIK